MNTFWLKIAAFALIVVAVIVLIGVFSHSKRPEPLSIPTAAEPVNKPAKTFDEQVERDKEKFLTPPRPPGKKPAEEAIKQPVQEQNKPPVTQTPQQPAKPSEQPAQLYFAPLSGIDKIEAERLLNVAVPGRSIGRLPIATDYQLMIEPCRQIIKKWPDSWYAYRAKQMLRDVPVRLRERYKITPEELDISEFYKQRPGTVPFGGTDTTEEEESP
jgi:hypothetical protein